MTSAVVLNEDGKWEHYTPTSGVSGGKPLADHAEVDALRRQLRELEAQREAGAQEINRLHCEVIARDERIAALEAEEAFHKDLIDDLKGVIDDIHDALDVAKAPPAMATMRIAWLTEERDTARRAAAARLRAVKRMKRVAQAWRKAYDTDV